MGWNFWPFKKETIVERNNEIVSLSDYTNWCKTYAMPTWSMVGMIYEVKRGVAPPTFLSPPIVNKCAYCSRRGEIVTTCPGCGAPRT